MMAEFEHLSSLKLEDFFLFPNEISFQPLLMKPFMSIQSVFQISHQEEQKNCNNNSNELRKMSGYITPSNSLIQRWKIDEMLTMMKMLEEMFIGPGSWWINRLEILFQAKL